MSIQITLSDYYMGRDAKYPLDLLTSYRHNANITVDLSNRLLVGLKVANVPLTLNASGSIVNSGWRPPTVNAATPGASKTSLHMSCQAIDLYDPSGFIDEYLFHNQLILKDLGLWLEHPDSTPKWCHVQILPPRSGNRVFKP